MKHSLHIQHMRINSSRNRCGRTGPYGPMLLGVHGLYPRDSAVTGIGGVGAVAHGMFVKSKNSSRLGCAASRAVRCAVLPINRFSTNLITAVWSIGVCET